MRVPDLEALVIFRGLPNTPNFRKWPATSTLDVEDSTNQALLIRQITLQQSVWAIEAWCKIAPDLSPPWRQSQACWKQDWNFGRPNFIPHPDHKGETRWEIKGGNIWWPWWWFIVLQDIDIRWKPVYRKSEPEYALSNQLQDGPFGGHMLGTPKDLRWNQKLMRLESTWSWKLTYMRVEPVTCLPAPTPSTKFNDLGRCQLM